MTRNNVYLKACLPHPLPFFPSLRVDFHCRVIFPCVHVNLPGASKIETMYGRSRIRKSQKPRSTFTFTRSLSYTVSISFKHVNFTCVRTEEFRDSGNQPVCRTTSDLLLSFNAISFPRPVDRA